MIIHFFLIDNVQEDKQLLPSFVPLEMGKKDLISLLSQLKQIWQNEQPSDDLSGQSTAAL